jgi:hypothetical protein
MDAARHSMVAKHPRSNGAPVRPVIKSKPTKRPSGFSANTTEISRCDSLNTFTAKCVDKRKCERKGQSLSMQMRISGGEIETEVNELTVNP